MMKPLVVTMVLCQALCHAVAQHGDVPYGKAELWVQSAALSTDDTLELRVWEDVVGYEFRNPFSTYRATNVDGGYHFLVDSVAPAARMSLHLAYQQKKGKPAYGILEQLVISPGDSVTVSLSPQIGVMRAGGYDSGDPILLANWDAAFTGRGAEKYAAAYDAFLVGAAAFNSPSANPIKDNPEKSLQWLLAHMDTLEQESLQHLNRYREHIVPEKYRLLLADIHGLYGDKRLSILTRMLRAYPTDGEVRDSILEWCKRAFDRAAGFANTFDGTLALSPNAITYLEKYEELSYRAEWGNYDLPSLYEVMKKSTWNERAKDKVLTLLLMRRFHRNPLRSLFEDASRTITDPYCQHILASFEHVIAGNRALNFSLPDADGQYHELEALRGKMVLLDFWYAGCIPCRQYIKNVYLPVADAYNNRDDVVFVLISTDTGEVMKRVTEERGLTGKGIRNLYTDGQRFDHPVIRENGIHAYPFPMLVDKEGRVVASGRELKEIDKVKRSIDRALQP